LWTPARVPDVITVNASDASDNDASFSNYGSCSDLYAPGVNIRSAGIASTTEITTKSGTSMATPHVTGAVARILSEDPTLTPAAVTARLMSLATNIDFGLAQYGDPNKLLFMGIDPNSLVSRLAGADRYSTSVAISSSFSAGVPVVYVATGENYPDALSAASAAAVQGGPLLLTDPAYLPGVIRSEINRLRPTQIVVVGGAGAVSDAVYNELATLAPTIRRDSGPDRFSTSRLIAERAFTGRTVTTAFIATGHDFPDALSAGASAATLGAPVILVDGAAGSLDGGAQYLMQRLGVTKVYIAGGTGVVSSGIEASLKQAFGNSNVVRLSGPDRYSTSRAINAGTFTASQKIYLAVGTNFPDSLSGAALAGVAHAPLYIVPSTCVPGDVLYDINRYAATNVVLLGGAGVLSAKVAALNPC
jgi:putative cell wall-binding protein